MNAGSVGEKAAESTDNNSKSPYQKRRGLRVSQVVFWPQFHNEEGGILNNSKVLFNFLLQSPYSEVFLVVSNSAFIQSPNKHL